MKKIALLLALLLCLVPVLSACGAHSSAKKAAVAAFKAAYIKFDAEKCYEVGADTNLDMIKELASGDEAEFIKNSARAKQDSMSAQIKLVEALMDSDEIDVDIDYEVIYEETYKKGSDRFDAIKKSYVHAETDIGDEIDKVAVVGILATIEGTDDNDEDFVSADVVEYYCYKIDGDWYVCANDNLDVDG